MSRSTTVDIWQASREQPAGLARRREDRFARLLRHARAHSPLLQGLYAGLPEEGVLLTDLPPTRKPELMAHFDSWVTDPRLTRTVVEEFVADPHLVGTPLLGTAFVCRSSGTTGEPGLDVHDRRAMRVYRALGLRADTWWLTPRTSLAMLRRRLRWVSVVGTGGHYAGEAWMTWQGGQSRRRRRYVVLPVGRPLTELVARLDDLAPAVLTSYPSALDLLAAEQVEGRLRISPVIVEAAGECVTPDLRARVFAAFGVPLREAYSASECPVMAFSCDEEWLHVNSDWIVLEPVEADGTPTPLGRASHTVLLTNLANAVQPFLRYDLGDSVIAREDACPCGSALPAVRVHGRSSEVLVLAGAGGSVVRLPAPVVVTALDGVAGVRRTQLIQVSRAAVTLRVDVRPGRDAAAVRRATVERLRALLDEHGAAAVVIDLDEAPTRAEGRSGKFRQVVPAEDVAGLTDTG